MSRVIEGDCRAVLAEMPADSFDAVGDMPLFAAPVPEPPEDAGCRDLFAEPVVP